MSNNYSPEATKLMAKIRKMTSRIGKAKQAGDGGAVANSRASRSKMLTTLADKFNLYYWIDDDGKSQFGPLEEANEKVDIEKIKAAALTDGLYDSIRALHKTLVKYESMPPEELKKFLTDTISKRISKESEMLHEVQEEAGDTKTDLAFLENDDKSEGIDWESLNEDNDTKDVKPSPEIEDDDEQTEETINE
jgi:hypothetical protein